MTILKHKILWVQVVLFVGILAVGLCVVLLKSSALIENSTQNSIVLSDNGISEEPALGGEEDEVGIERNPLVHAEAIFSPSVPECDYDALKAQAEALFRAADFDRRLWTVAGVEEIEEPVDYYGSIANSDYTFRPCSVAITYRTQPDTEYSNDLRSALHTQLEQGGWSYHDPEEFVSQTGDSVKVVTSAADGTNGGSLAFVRQYLGSEAIQFAEVSNFDFRSNPVEFDGRGNIVNDLCPCWSEVTLKISAPVQLWSESAMGTGDHTTCDYDALRLQAEEIIESVDIDKDFWQLVSATATPSSEQYMFAMGEVGDIVPCSFKLTYTGPVTDNLPENFAPTLFDTLHSSSWHSDMYQTLISDSTGASTTVALAHAGGPLGDTTIFTNALYDERAVQFIRVSERRYFENLLEVRDGLVDSPCPCRNEVSLEISAPVSFAGWLGE